jgi:hypothetical protein
MWGKDLIVMCSRVLEHACYDAAKQSGWHNDLKTGEEFTIQEQFDKFPVRIALMHSELSEALEGHRSNKIDDKLPNRRMLTVELADAVIRIFDCAGAMQLDLPSVIAEKLEYNLQRADHKPEARLQPSGKKY